MKFYMFYTYIFSLLVTRSSHVQKRTRRSFPVQTGSSVDRPSSLAWPGGSEPPGAVGPPEEAGHRDPRRAGVEGVLGVFNGHPYHLLRS